MREEFVNDQWLRGLLKYGGLVLGVDVETVALDAATQRVVANTQQLRGFAAVPSRFGERGENHAAFAFVIAITSTFLFKGLFSFDEG